MNGNDFPRGKGLFQVFASLYYTMIELILRIPMAMFNKFYV